MDSKYISGEEFKKRLIDLCLRSGLTDFPTKHRDQLVMLKSIAISFDSAKVYTEGEVNERIKSWLNSIGDFSNWDYMMLRRRLVDERLLSRNPDGSGYWVCSDNPAGMTFDPAIAGYDIGRILEEGQKMIAQKKADYLSKKEC